MARPSTRSGDRSPDILGLYLEGAGSVPLLSRDQEVLRAQEIEKHETELAVALLSTGAGVHELLHVADKLEDGRLQASDVIKGASPKEPTAADLSQRTAAALRRAAALAAAADQAPLRALIAELHLSADIIGTIAQRVEPMLRDLAQRATAKDEARKRHLERVRQELGAREDQLLSLHVRVIDAQRAAERARAAMVSANLRLVASVARQYRGKTMELLDLIQEGNLGLLKAVEKYDWRRGFKFSTYACWWIRQSIHRALMDHDRLIRVPVHVYERRKKILATLEEITQREGREGTAEEVAAALELPAAEVRQVFESFREPMSLDAPLGDEESASLADFLASTAVDSPSTEVEKLELFGHVRQCLATLDAREEEVLRRRFGIGHDEENTLEEIAQDFGVTRERVRQIEAKALSKLNKPNRRRVLQAFAG